MSASKQAQRVLDHLERRIGKELMASNNHTLERYEKLIQGIVSQGTFTAEQVADIMIRYHDAIWNNLKTE